MMLHSLGYSQEFYKSYVQINPSTEKGKVFLLAVMSPISGNEEDDRAMANFTLDIGQSEEKVFLHKNYPNRKYIFKANAWTNKSEKVGVKLDFKVTDSDLVVYQSEQVVGAWKSF